MNKSESKIQSEVLIESRKVKHIRLYRNNVGGFWQGKIINKTATTITLLKPRFTECGLRVGSSDLIGWKTITVTPDMVGRDVAVFCSAELKTAKGKAEDEQKNWLQQVESAGGIAGIVRSVEDYNKIFAGEA